MNRKQAENVAREIRILIDRPLSSSAGPLIEALCEESAPVTEAKFKVGDRVKVREDGRIGTVIKALPHVEKNPKRPLIKYDDGYQGWHWEGTLERMVVEVTLTEDQRTTLVAFANYVETNPQSLWSSHVVEVAKRIDPSGAFFERAREQFRKTAEPARFKVGDRVRMIKKDHSHYGQEGQIVELHPTAKACQVTYSTGSFYVPMAWLGFTPTETVADAVPSNREWAEAAQRYFDSLPVVPCCDTRCDKDAIGYTDNGFQYCQEHRDEKTARYKVFTSYEASPEECTLRALIARSRGASTNQEPWYLTMKTGDVFHDENAEYTFQFKDDLSYHAVKRSSSPWILDRWYVEYHCKPGPLLKS